MLQVVIGTISRVWRSIRDAGIGDMQTIQIRALVFQENGFWCAQCLERDIAVQAHSKEELFSELAKVLTTYVEIALEDGRAPFSDLPPAPRHFEEMFDRAADLGDGAPIKILQPSDAPQIVPTFRVLQHA